MDTNGVGWLAAIIIGGLAEWLVAKLMSTSLREFVDIILGVVGACLLIVIGRTVSGRSPR